MSKTIIDKDSKYDLHERLFRCICLLFHSAQKASATMLEEVRDVNGKLIIRKH